MLEHKESSSEKITAEYIPSHGMSPREFTISDSGKNISDDNYEPPKKSYSVNKNGITAFVQPYYNGGGFSVANTEAESKFYLTVKHGYDENSLAEAAVDCLCDTVDNTDLLYSKHFDWWNSFYKKSYISIDNGVYEGFIYIQLYKLACAGRNNSVPFDTCGPWLTDNTRWPGAWWNLNVELTISPLYISNHIDISQCVTNSLKNGKNELINNVPEKYRTDCAAIGRSTTSGLYSPVTVPGDTDADNGFREAGNLVWALSYCYQEYRMTGEEAVLKDVVYPLLKRAIQYYLYFLYIGKDGKLHLKATLSPEYAKSDSEDVNYDLSLLRWGCTKLIEISEILDIDDEKMPEWKNVLENLTDYPHSDEEGYFIAADTHYEESHRHYSHLLMFYPLHLLDMNNKENQIKVETSINFWQGKPDALQGYSQSGAASMRAMQGDGNKALYHLEKLWRGFIHPNTMYEEGENPVLETPPSAATSILNMLIQSHDGYINIFPAVPDIWRNICFDRLLCYDCFEASARRCDGKTEWIKIKSLKGNKCVVKADFGNEKLFSSGSFTVLKNGMYEINIEEGEEIIVSTIDSPCCEEIKIKKKTMNCYGLNKRNRRIR